MHLSGFTWGGASVIPMYDFDGGIGIVKSELALP